MVIGSVVCDLQIASRAELLTPMSFEDWKAQYGFTDKIVDCYNCRGRGSYRCYECHGRGYIMEWENPTLAEDDCEDCDGSGVAECYECGGTGMWNDTLERYREECDRANTIALTLTTSGSPDSSTPPEGGG